MRTLSIQLWSLLPGLGNGGVCLDGSDRFSPEYRHQEDTTAPFVEGPGI